MSGFKKAERKQAKLKIGLAGPSGSGKTLSALLMAGGIGTRIAVIDTENDSASLYAGMQGVPEFDSMNLEPPFSTDKYCAAIRAAVDAGYDVLIIDSGSHQWAGDGGILSKKEQLDARGGNSYAHWAKLTPEHERFKASILHADIHIIVTLRSKQEYALAENEKGRNTVKKLGMAPIQRDGMEYEFTTMFDIAIDHHAQASKDRTGLWDGQIFKISADTGRRFIEWLAGAKPLPPRQAEPQAQTQQPRTTAQPQARQTMARSTSAQAGVTEAQIRRLFAIARASNWTEQETRDYLGLQYGRESFMDLTRAEYDAFCKHLEQNPYEAEAPKGEHEAEQQMESGAGG